jgi:cytochrome c-type biogenesis protein CcmF
MAIAAAVSILLMLRRLELLRTQTKLESLVSREATFLYNNLLFVALALTILWGVTYPIVTQLLRGVASQEHGGYYDFFLRVFGLPLLFLMGVAPLVAWRRASLRSLGRTFLTRSGVVNSIHSFAQSSIGTWFLAAIAIAAAVSIYLILTRLDLLRSETKLESFVSREVTFLYNNLLLVALALAILWGVTSPIVSQVIHGVPSNKHQGYYDFFLKAFGLPLLFLMGIAPLLAWRRASWRSLRTSFAVPACVAVAVGILLLAIGDGSSLLGLVAYTLAAFVLASIGYELVRGTQARKALGATSWLGALGSLVARNRRRYGGYVVHAAIVLLALGITGTGVAGTHAEGMLYPGQSLRAGDYTLTYLNQTVSERPNVTELRVGIAVSRGGHSLGTLHPGKNAYLAEQQTSNEMAIRHDAASLGDLAVIADQINQSGRRGVYVKALVKPLINLIWVAGFVFVLGSAITLWPDAREQRRLAARYDEALAPVLP